MASPEPKEHTYHILLVEDDAFLRDMFERKLQNSPFSLTLTGTADEAISIINKEKPDIVLLDLNLPEGSGFTVLETIRRDPELANTLVLVLTNSVLNEDVIKSHELKADDFLTKANFSLDEILERIEQHIARKLSSKTQ